MKYYNEQKEKYSTSLEAIKRRINTFAMLRLCAAIVTFISGICALRSSTALLWWATAVSLAVFLLLVRTHTSLQKKKEILDIHLLLVNNELLALSGDITPFRDGGRYIDTAHPYSYDLDLFGKGSIYQLLCRTVTNGGTAMLADKLSHLVLVKEEIIGRQQIIKELSTMPGLLQQFRVAGTLVPEGNKDQARLKEWLQGPEFFINNTFIRIAAVLMPLLSVACIAWSIITGTVFSWMSFVIVTNWVILGIFQKTIRPVLEQIGNIAPLVDKYTGLLTEVATTDYTSPWLSKMGADAKKSVKEIVKFKDLIRLFDSRENGLVGPLMNSLFLFDIYCLLRLEAWRKKHGTLLINAIDNMTAADVFISCAVYAFNHPDNVYPEINTSGLQIVAKDLRHPLLPPAIAIGNDTIIGREEQFYLLTGANMTGKSTFIRTIGVCTVLANLGLPLPARSMSLPLLELYTSMRITDSVQDDISYFRAELNRIKAIMDEVQSSPTPYLILLDEPLRGTNSTDKQQGTRAIVENLLTYHAIGIVATHDTGLCDMETTYSGKVRNYHFESKVEPGGLSFDFKLLKGASTSNNATILMRQMGIVK